MIAQLTALLPIVQVPTILDASNLDVTEAFNAYKTMPFSFFQPTINETETVTNRWAVTTPILCLAPRTERRVPSCGTLTLRTSRHSDHRAARANDSD